MMWSPLTSTPESRFQWPALELLLLEATSLKRVSSFLRAQYNNACTILIMSSCVNAEVKVETRLRKRRHPSDEQPAAAIAGPSKRPRKQSEGLLGSAASVRLFKNFKVTLVQNPVTACVCNKQSNTAHEEGSSFHHHCSYLTWSRLAALCSLFQTAITETARSSSCWY